MLSVKFHVSTGLGVVGGDWKNISRQLIPNIVLIIEDKELKLNY